MKTRRTWQEKLHDDKDLPKVVVIPPKMRASHGKGSIVIARPRDVDALMRSVPKGKLTTIDALRATLAEMHGATIACPMTTGIFASIAARAAEERSWPASGASPPTGARSRPAAN